MKLTAVIVLYNPSNEVLDIYENLSKQLKSVIYVDNSDIKNDKIKNFFINQKNTEYYSMSGNVGLAKALNFGCIKAIENGYTHAILFDQDTWLDDGCIEKLTIECKNKHAALVSPNLKSLYRENNLLKLTDKPQYPEKIFLAPWVITSGSLLDLEVYEELGGFDNKLFIGQIDQDYCCNLYTHKKSVILVGNAFILQEAGKIKKHKFLNREIADPNYDAIRHYYIFRNEHYLRIKWKKDYSNQKVKLWKYILLILIYRSKKLYLLRSCIKGWKQGGKYINEKNI